MANNSISTLIEEIFAAGVQEILRKNLIGEMICGKKAHKELNAGGDTFNYGYVSRGVLQTYSSGTGVTKHYFKGTNEQMSLSTKKVFNFFLDDTEMRQSKKRAAYLAQKNLEGMEAISIDLDGSVMNRYQDATYKYGANGITQSTTTAGKTISVANLGTSFGKVFAFLKNRVGKLKSKFMVVDDFIADVITEAAIGNTFQTGDLAFKNGYAGTYKGFKIYVSNNLTTEVVLTIGAGTIAEDDYITIKESGTFTFKDTLTANGQLHVANSVANNAINIAAAINAPGTDITESATAGYDAWEGTDGDQLFDLDGLEATATSTTVSIVSKRGLMMIVSSFADDAISFGTEVVHCIAGEEGAIELAYQEKGKVYVNNNPVDSSGNTILGKEYNYLMMSGVKTFREGKRKLIDVQLNSLA
jgi:hypothetical protein